MEYKVVTFDQTDYPSRSLQQIIDAEAVDGYQYISHEYSDKLKPGKAGCFGIGAKPDVTVHVGFVVLGKQA